MKSLKQLVKPVRRKARSHSARPALEALETRQLLASSIGLSGGILR